jgi:hypothetical protein
MSDSLRLQQKLAEAGAQLDRVEASVRRLEDLLLRVRFAEGGETDGTPTDL